jgi:thiol-disulfide isomerase/thioredoxin
VIIDFWTYSCINCIRTLPYLRQRHDRYADKGLVIIWVHAPEFQFEKDLDNVRQAVSDFGLLYPIVQDNDFQTWRNYDNHYRPAKYIIDAKGVVRYTHFWEGWYDKTETVIQWLLEEAGMLSGEQSQTIDQTKDIQSWFDPDQTAETYVWTARRTTQAWSASAYAAQDAQDHADSYTRWTQWTWTSNPEYIVLDSQTGSLSLRWYSREANLVLGSASGKPIDVDVIVNGNKTKTITVTSHTLYQLFKASDYTSYVIELRSSQAGLEAYAYTFG